VVEISVVIPAYNAEKSLGECIQSVLNQTLQPLEIIVINDGSTDSTEDIALSYPVRYLKQSNQGQASARNKGIAEARGAWIAFIDSDDIMLPTKLKKQSDVIASDPELVVVYTGFTYFYPNGETQDSPAFPSEKLWPALRYRQPILPSTAVVKKDALVKAGMFALSKRRYFAEDWDLWFRLFPIGRFTHLPECLTLYRIWDANTSKNFMQFADANLELSDTLLLSDLRGIRRAVWKRRLEAKIYHEVAMGMRDAGDSRFWSFEIASLLAWPLWGRVVPLSRYKVAANMLWVRMKTPELALRYWWPERRCREVLRLPLI
jgi:glycosyltransferase involved in cell wall biosynthesis